MTQEMEEFSITKVRLAFRDITRNRHSGSPNLISQAVNLPLWKLIRSVIYSLHQIHRPLPSDKVFVVFRHSDTAYSEDSVLGTCNSVLTLNAEYASHPHPARYSLDP